MNRIAAIMAAGLGSFNPLSLAAPLASAAGGPVAGGAVSMFTGGIMRAIGGKGGVPRPAGVPKPPAPPIGSLQVRWNKSAGRLELMQYIRHPGLRNVPLWVPLNETRAMPDSAFKGDGRQPLFLPDGPADITLTNLGEIDPLLRLAALQQGQELPWGPVHTGTLLGQPFTEPNRPVSLPIPAGALASIRASLRGGAVAGLNGLGAFSTGGLGMGPAIFASGASGGAGIASGGGGFDWGGLASGLLQSAAGSAASIGMDLVRQRLGLNQPQVVVPTFAPAAIATPLPAPAAVSTPPSDAGALNARRDALRQRLIDLGNAMTSRNVPLAQRKAALDPLHVLYALVRDWTHEATTKGAMQSRINADNYAAQLDQGLKRLEGGGSGGSGLLLAGAALVALLALSR